MPDVIAKWPPLPDRATARLEGAGILVRQLDGIGETLVSGDLDAAAARAGVEPRGVGALGLATGDTYAVRLARDRLLIVSPADPGLGVGWRAEGYAVTAASGGSAVFEISGEHVDEVVARATNLPVGGNGPSAATVFAGASAVLYRHGRPTTLRLHVDRAHGPYAWQWLAEALACLG